MSHATPKSDAPPPSTEGDGSEPRGPSLTVTVGNVLGSLGLSLAVLIGIAYFTFEPDAYRQVADRVNPWWLSAALLTVVLRVLIGGWRLTYISHRRLGVMAGIRGQLAWDFFSNVTPSVIGGGPLAAVYIARDRNTSLGDATALLLFAMLLDQLWFAFTVPIILVSAFYLDVIPGTLGVVGEWTIVGYFIALMSWVGLFGYATLVRPDLLHRLADAVFRIRWLRRFRARMTQEMVQLRYRAQIIRSQPLSFFFVCCGITAVSWLVRYLLLVFLIWSVYAQLDVLLVFMRTVAMTLGSLILPTPGGAGGVEGLYYLFLGPPVLPKALVAPTLLAWRVLGYYLFIALGVFLSMHQVQKTIKRRRAAANGVEGTGEDALQPEPADSLRE